MTSSFPLTSSAPAATSASRLASNPQQSRTSLNPPSSTRSKATYDNRRYTNPQKRNSQPPLTSNANSVPVFTRVDVAPLPQPSAGLRHQMSSPGRLQRMQPTANASQYSIPTASLLDPVTIVRSRAAQLPQNNNNKGAIHRNAISLNTLATNHQSGSSMARGRSQTSAQRRAQITRTARLRQQSLAAADVQHSSTSRSSPKVIYRTASNNEHPPVFFE